jgi:hypothetical protein
MAVNLAHNLLLWQSLLRQLFEVCNVPPARSYHFASTQADGTTMGRRGFHHNVYVVELDRAVLREPRFVRCNPDYRPGALCVYVGMTGLQPDERFDKHKAGIRANRFVERYGLRLLPALYECFNPMPFDAACELEVELGIEFRARGFGVWQA